MAMTSDGTGHNESGPGPGWHPDPWFSGQHRYWDGRTWTGDVFPDGPTESGALAQVTLRDQTDRPPVPPPAARSAAPPPPPTWGYSAAAAPVATSVFEPWETLDPPQPAPRRRLTAAQVNALALAVGLLVGFVVVEKAVAGHGHRSPAAIAPAPTSPTVPTVPASPAPGASNPVSNDRSAQFLQRLVVRQSDVPSADTVQLLDGGNAVTGETTLDLCNGTYPSEALRSARLQVVEYDGAGSGVLSTEAVLYRHGGDAVQAMNEIRSVAARCPDSPVVSPVGEPTIITGFQSRPDGSWPKVDGVTRQAYAFTTTDSLGVTDTHIAVYLQRGRVLEGVYFPAPAGAQPAVDGQTSIAAIAHVFAERIAALPASAVAG
jgi:hypothetical protein